MLEGMMLNIGLCIVIASVAVYFMLKERYKYFKKRGVPYKEPVFLLGSMPRVTFHKENFVNALTRIYRETPTVPVVGIFQMHQPVYLVKDPGLIQRILIKDFSNFHDHGFPIDEKTNPLEGHLFSMTGTKWRTLRNKLTPTFTSGKLKGMLPLMDTIVDQLIEVLDKRLGQDIDIKDTYSRLTMDILGSCTFGIDSGSITDQKSEFLEMGSRFFNPPLKIVLRELARFFFPTLTTMLKFKTIPDDINNFFFSITKQTIDHRIRTGEKRNDFLQLLLELKLKGEVQKDSEELKDDDDKYLYHEVSSHQLEDNGKLVIDDGLLAAQAFVFLVGGFETSATSLSFVTYLLSKHQDVQEKLRQEVREKVAKHGGFNYDAIRAMPYLAACIDEGLRMYPPNGALFRQCNRDFALDDGTNIEKGMQVFIPIAAIMMDETHFPNPEEFRPERFLEGDPFPGTYLPFGDGPRVCIAQRFAQLKLKLVLARMVDRYRIETCPKMAANEPIKLNTKTFIPMVVGGLHCRLRLLQESS